MSKLVRTPAGQPVTDDDAERQRDRDATAAYAFAAMSAATRRAYGEQWRAFLVYATRHGDHPLPARADLVARYLASLAKARASFSRINLARAAIAAAHREMGDETNPTKHPDVVKVMRGIARELGTAQQPKRALTYEQLTAMADVDFGSPMRNLRNRALLLFAFAVPLRRSELAALRCSDLEDGAGGIDVRVRRSKTNQLGRRDIRGMPRLVDRSGCPCVAVRAWTTFAGLSADAHLWPVILRGPSVARNRRISGEAVARIVKHALSAIGVDSTHYSGHSLRRGSLTCAAKNGADMNAIMRQAGHVDPKSTMRYIEVTDLYGSDNASRYAMGEKKRDKT